ncbi:MAG TPA: metal-dependent hydrolase [Candidatus Saccharimonadales bacterium]|jgi:membrane-bound metal-dependent hydrolase YbcI (DUF457 family)|nr:metal-dependent hydrolase [Candidatus Saccharimonadales bacterium]
MDTITHGIVGALLGKALFAGPDVPATRSRVGEIQEALSSPTARVAIAACTLGAMFPDIDVFAGTLAHNPLAIMEWHRNITHSIVLLPLWAFLLTAISIPLSKSLRWKSPPFLFLFGIYAVGLASHIFLDLVTTFGTMVWSPVRYSRPAWDLIFILDLTVTSIALVPQLTAWCYREPHQFKRRAISVWAALTVGAFGTYLFASATGYGFPLPVVAIASAIFAAILYFPFARGAGFRWTRANWCRAGLATLCIYIGLATAQHHKALADVEQFAAAQHLQVDKLAALPLPPTLTHWVGLVTTPQGVWRTTFHEPSGSVEKTQLYVEAPPNNFIEQAKKLRDVQVYLWFARFPVWRMRQTRSGETVVEISDVRFFRENAPELTDPPQAPMRVSGIRARTTGFTFQIIFDTAGKVISHGFREPE